MSETTYKASGHRYWAAEDPEHIGEAVQHKFDEYQRRLRDEGRDAIWRIADRCLHGRDGDGGYSNSVAISFGGEEGELAQIHVGHYRDLVRRMHTIATGERPTIELSAANNDPESVAETVIARQLIEYDLDEEDLEAALHEAHKRALVYSEGYVVQTWDYFGGELLGTRLVEPEAVDVSAPGIPGSEGDAAPLAPVEVPVYQGTIRTTVRSPMDVAHDLDRESVKGSPWFVVRTREHRWELAARFPESAEKRRAILDAPPAHDDAHPLWERKSSSTGSDSDYISVLTLYHVPTDAIPQGRQVVVVDETVLFDDPYPEDHCVVHADIPSEELDRAAGYGETWDLLALSQALDGVESGMLTVYEQGALIRYKARKGQSVDVRQLSGFLELVEYDDDGVGGDGPRLMERAEVRESDHKLADHYRSSMEMLSGVNATVRGSAESEVKSGADRALIATMAVKANSAQQGAFAHLSRSVLNGRLALYRKHLQAPKLIERTGRDAAGHLAMVTAEQLSKVRRVKVELGPADLRTIEGKTALAKDMLEAYGPDVVTPARYQAIRATGRIDDFLDPIEDHKILARRENDLFREGQGERVQAMLYHHHACHIREHANDLNNLELVMNPNRVAEIQARLAHIEAHVAQWQATPPEVLKATGQDPAPSSMMGGGPPPMQGPAPGPMPPGMGGEPPPPEAAADGGPVLPSLPTIPGAQAPGVPGMTDNVEAIQ